jgi:dipeptidyl aminopeptidase/acylaminoacyl peptidase
VFGPHSLHQLRSPAFVPQLAPAPTLIIAGERDRCTPVGQAEQLFNKLTREGVDTELVIYPREGHVLTEGPHVIDATERTIAWFDRHLSR